MRETCFDSSLLLSSLTGGGAGGVLRHHGKIWLVICGESQFTVSRLDRLWVSLLTPCFRERSARWSRFVA